VIDVNDGLGGDGPFSPERAGGVPAFGLIDLCFEQKMSKSQIKKALVGQGGLYSYLGTSDARKIEDQAHQHNSKANFYLKAMCYQVVKEIGALYFIANGQIDQLIITGGLAHSKLIIKYLMTYLKGLIKITIYPGEDEMSALMLGAKRILDKTEKAQRY
jgi:butyrate kinase